MRIRCTGAIAGVAGRAVPFGAGCSSKQSSQSKQCATFSVEILSDGQGHGRRRTRAEARSERNMGGAVIRLRCSPAEGRDCGRH